MNDFVKVSEVSFQVYDIIRAYEEKVKSQNLLQKAQLFGSSDVYDLNKEYQFKEEYFQNKINSFINKVLNGSYVCKE